MKLLHTSDWHIGRTFHGYDTVRALRGVLDALAAQVREHSVDVVLVAGDVFDSAMPAAEHYTLLTDALVALREAGAEVVLTSGNHDSAARLGFQSTFLGRSGVHVITDPAGAANPLLLRDEFGEVALYGVPYLEPALFRHRHPDAGLKTHDDVIAFVTGAIRADAEARGVRSVVLSHCFVADVRPGGAAAAAAAAAAPADGCPENDAPRDITAGGLDLVSLDRFTGFDYAALGHIHGRATLAETVRYSGAPLHYSFGEAGKPRGSWLVTLGPNGFEGAEWLDLPVPRRLSVLTGTLSDLLTNPAHADREGDWVSAIITDAQRPPDAMPHLKSRFEWCAKLEFRPAERARRSELRYAARIAARTDTEIVGEFLADVRGGLATTAAEASILADALAAPDRRAEDFAR